MYSHRIVLPQVIRRISCPEISIRNIALICISDNSTDFVVAKFLPAILRCIVCHRGAIDPQPQSWKLATTDVRWYPSTTLLRFHPFGKHRHCCPRHRLSIAMPATVPLFRHSVCWVSHCCYSILLQFLAGFRFDKATAPVIVLLATTLFPTTLLSPTTPIALSPLPALITLFRCSLHRCIPSCNPLILQIASKVSPWAADDDVRFSIRSTTQPVALVRDWSPWNS